MEPKDDDKICMDCKHSYGWKEQPNAITWYRNNTRFYSYFFSFFNPLKYVYRTLPGFSVDVSQS